MLIINLFRTKISNPISKFSSTLLIIKALTIILIYTISLFYIVVSFISILNFTYKLLINIFLDIKLNYLIFYILYLYIFSYN